MTTDPENEHSETADSTYESDDSDAESDAESSAGDRVPDVPSDVVDEAERLTRLARNAVDPDEAEAYRDRRAKLVEDHDYTPRIREEDDTLVCYPTEWVEDGTVQFDRIENTDRAVERSLTGPGDPDEWDSIEDTNAAVVERVREAATDVHADNARAFADFMGNHYAREVWTANEPELAEFREEYYPRNVWADDEQEQALDRSLELLFEYAEEIRE